MRSKQPIAAALALLLLPCLVACRGRLDSTRATAEETAAIAQLRTISRAQATFSADHNHYACTLPELGSQFGLIDRELSYGQKDGYYFNLQCSSRGGVSAWDVWATPVGTSIAGSTVLCVDESGAVRSASHRLDECRQATPIE